MLQRADGRQLRHRSRPVRVAARPRARHPDARGARACMARMASSTGSRRADRCRHAIPRPASTRSRRDACCDRLRRRRRAATARGGPRGTRDVGPSARAGRVDARAVHVHVARPRARRRRRLRLQAIDHPPARSGRSCRRRLPARRRRGYGRRLRRRRALARARRPRSARAGDRDRARAARDEPRCSACVSATS